MDREAWHAAACGVVKSQTWLGEWTITIVIMLPLMEEMFVPWANVRVQLWVLQVFPGGSAIKEPACNAGDPGSPGSWVRKIPWRREWQHTPVFLPGKSHGQRSLVGCSPWGCRLGPDWACTQSILSCEVRPWAALRAKARLHHHSIWVRTAKVWCGPRRSSDERAELLWLLFIRRMKGLDLLCGLKAGELSAAATGTVDPAWGHLHVQSEV